MSSILKKILIYYRNVKNIFNKTYDLYEHILLKLTYQLSLEHATLLA